MDLDIRNLKEELINTLNSHQLPIEVKRLVLSELLVLVTEMSNKAIKEQKFAGVEGTTNSQEGGVEDASS